MSSEVEDDRMKDSGDDEVDLAGTSEQDDQMLSANIDDQGDEVP